MPGEGVLYESVRVIESKSDLRGLFLGAVGKVEGEEVVLDCLMLHKLVKERNLTRLSHARVSKTNESIEMPSEDVLLLIDFTEVKVANLNGLAGVVGISQSHGISGKETLKPSRAEPNSALRVHIRFTGSLRL